ncbi:MAG: hypothetical protein ACFFA3_20525 [Promethearchaeota archaeon]
MYCYHCGERLVNEEQTFCQNCGARIHKNGPTTEYKPKATQVMVPPKTVYVPVRPQPQIQRGLPGRYSKLCLYLALGSVLIGVLSIVFGYNLLYRFYYPYNYLIRLNIAVVMLLARIGGLIMGVFSRINSSKATLFEPYNDSERAGSIIAVLGIIANSIGLFLSLMGPWSVFSFPY